MMEKALLAQARHENRIVRAEIEAKRVLMESGISRRDMRPGSTKDAAVRLSEEFGHPERQGRWCGSRYQEQGRGPRF